MRLEEAEGADELRLKGAAPLIAAKREPG